MNMHAATFDVYQTLRRRHHQFVKDPIKSWIATQLSIENAIKPKSVPGIHSIIAQNVTKRMLRVPRRCILARADWDLPWLGIEQHLGKRLQSFESVLVK